MNRNVSSYTKAIDLCTSEVPGVHVVSDDTTSPNNVEPRRIWAFEL